jgi:hypothetical protein
LRVSNDSKIEIIEYILIQAYITTMKSIIIEGYKGVMPLDLTDVDPKYHKIMIDQHKEDIKEYNRYQQSLPFRLQYENTTKKAKNLLQSDQEWTTRISDKKRLEQSDVDTKYHERQQLYLQSIQHYELKNVDKTSNHYNNTTNS